MPEQWTRDDSIGMYHTGAASDEAAQTDPDLSLGNYISSTRISHVEAQDMTPNLGSCAMTIVFIAGANGLDNGTLTAASADTVTWTPPGGSVGAAVTIANGETKVVEGSSQHKYVVVTRDSATDMSASATVTIVQSKPNAIGFDGVSSAEQTAGDNEYRCIGLKNKNSTEVKDVKVRLELLGTPEDGDVSTLPASGAGTIVTSESFADWPQQGYAVSYRTTTQYECIYYSSRTDTTLTVPAAGRGMFGTTEQVATVDDVWFPIPGHALGKEAPSSQPNGNFTDKTGAGEGSAPGGVTFSLPVVYGSIDDSIEIGDLDNEEIYAVWEWREIPAGATSDTGAHMRWGLTFDAA